MPIQRKDTVILAIENWRNTKKISPEEANSWISKINANADLSLGAKRRIDYFLVKDQIKPVFSGLSKRGVSC